MRPAAFLRSPSPGVQGSRPGPPAVAVAAVESCC